MPQLKNERITLRCTADEARTLKKAAKALDIRVTDFIRQAIDYWVSKYISQIKRK